MAHFAKLDENNLVVFVTVGSDEDNEQELTERTGEVYKQTSYNTYAGEHKLGGTPLRKNYAGLGFIYDEQRDAFIPPKPYDSWLLDEDTCIWVSPVQYPTDKKFYIWDENIINWVEIPVE